jgi:hypothetical protein
MIIKKRTEKARKILYFEKDKIQNWKSRVFREYLQKGLYFGQIIWKSTLWVVFRYL